MKLTHEIIATYSPASQHSHLPLIIWRCTVHQKSGERKWYGDGYPGSLIKLGAQECSRAVFAERGEGRDKGSS